MNEVEGGYSFSELMAVVRRRFLVVLAFILLGIGVAAAFVTTSGAAYEATARVVVRPITVDPFASNVRPTDLVNAGSEAAVLRSDAVIGAVKEQLGLEADIPALRSRVAVVNPEGSLTLEIAYLGPSPEKAQAGANAFAQAYLDERERSAKESLDRTAATLQEQAATLQTQLLAALDLQRAAPPGSPAAAEASAQVESVRTRLSAIEERKNQLLSVDTTPGQVVQAASLPAAPSGVPPIILAVGIVGVFTMVGLGIALLLDRRDPRAGGLRDVERLVPDGYVEVLPAAKRRADNRGSARESALARVVVRLVTSENGDTGSALVSGADDRLPVGIVQELVDVLEDRGHRSLVVCTGSVDALPYRIVVRRLGAVLQGDEELDDLDPADGGSTIWLVPEEGVRVRDLLRRKGVKEVLRAAVQRFDTVLFVAPTPARFSSTLDIARSVDAVLVVARHGVARSDLRDTVEALVDSGHPPSEVLIT